VIARRIFSASILAAVLAFGVPALAQKPASAPKDATAQCKDNTYSKAKTEQGACSSHGGVKTWWGSEAAAPAAPSKPSPNPSKPSPKESAPAPKAKTQAGRPADATAQCQDGTYSTAKTKQGACSRHGGVATWFADATAAPAPPSPTPRTAPPTEKPAPPAPTTPTTKSNAAAPENATAKCKDGSYSYAKQHSGACSHHGGVAEWYK
jgi:hypothetical protein